MLGVEALDVGCAPLERQCLIDRTLVGNLVGVDARRRQQERQATYPRARCRVRGVVRPQTLENPFAHGRMTENLLWRYRRRGADELATGLETRPGQGCDVRSALAADKCIGDQRIASLDEQRSQVTGGYPRPARQLELLRQPSGKGEAFLSWYSS